MTPSAPRVSRAAHSAVRHAAPASAKCRCALPSALSSLSAPRIASSAASTPSTAPMSPAAAASSCAATRGFAPAPPPSTLKPIMRIWEDCRCAMSALPMAPPSHEAASSAWGASRLACSRRRVLPQRHPLEA
eukprot:3970784-Pleurochrysis_carterae.AAC.1